MRTYPALITRQGYTEGAGEAEPADVPMHEPDSGMSASQLLTIVRYYWKITAAVTVLIAVSAAVLIKYMPKTYTATATLIIDEGKKDPLSTSDAPDNGLASYIGTQMELITSPIILQGVVDKMHLSNDPLFAAGYSGGDAAGLREYTARNLASALQVDQGRGGELLYITASARSPSQAAAIANAVTSVYMDEERRRSHEPATARARRYSDEVDELRAKVTAAQENLAAFRQHRGLTDVSGTNGAGDTASVALADLEQRLLDAQNLRRSLEAKSAGQQSTADEALASPIIQQLKTQLSAQQTQLAQLSVTEGANHPKVLELKSQMSLTQRQLDTELATLSENVSTQLARARALETQYSQALAEQRTKVLQVRQLQGEGEKLQLELDSALSVYKRALDGMDQIVFASANDNTYVELISAATPPSRPSKPNKLRLLLMACVAGLGFGLVGPLAYELLLNRRLRCRDDIERVLGIPVLAEFDRIKASSSA